MFFSRLKKSCFLKARVEKEIFFFLLDSRYLNAFHRLTQRATDVIPNKNDYEDDLQEKETKSMAIRMVEHGAIAK